MGAIQGVLVGAAGRKAAVSADAPEVEGVVVVGAAGRKAAVGAGSPEVESVCSSVLRAERLLLVPALQKWSVVFVGVAGRKAAVGAGVPGGWVWCVRRRRSGKVEAALGFAELRTSL